jgi:hypothetical protein
VNDIWSRGNPYSFPGCEKLRLDSISNFVEAILSGRADAINYCLYEARQRKMLLLLFQEICAVPSPPLQARIAFHRAWITQGLWIRDNFASDAPLLDVLVKMLPGYSGPPMELFRGERGSNHAAGTYGPSWTAKRSVAETFAKALNRCPQTGGLLLRTIAPTEAILAAPTNAHPKSVEESEYVVDRRALERVEVLEIYAPEDERDTNAT